MDSKSHGTHEHSNVIGRQQPLRHQRQGSSVTDTETRLGVYVFRIFFVIISLTLKKKLEILVMGPSQLPFQVWKTVMSI